MAHGIFHPKNKRGKNKARQESFNEDFPFKIKNVKVKNQYRRRDKYVNQSDWSY